MGVKYPMRHPESIPTPQVTLVYIPGIIPASHGELIGPVSWVNYQCRVHISAKRTEMLSISGNEKKFSAKIILLHFQNKYLIAIDIRSVKLTCLR